MSFNNPYSIFLQFTEDFSLLFNTWTCLKRFKNSIGHKAFHTTLSSLSTLTLVDVSWNIKNSSLLAHDTHIARLSLYFTFQEIFLYISVCLIKNVHPISWHFISEFSGCQFDRLIRRRADRLLCQPSQLKPNIYLLNVHIRTLSLINSSIRSFGCWSNKLLFHPCLPFVFYGEGIREDEEEECSGGEESILGT